MKPAPAEQNDESMIYPVHREDAQDLHATHALDRHVALAAVLALHHLVIVVSLQIVVIALLLVLVLHRLVTMLRPHKTKVVQEAVRFHALRVVVARVLIHLQELKTNIIEKNRERLFRTLYSLAPFPSYALLIILVSKHECLSQFENIPILFLTGFLCIIEILQMSFYSPPKTYDKKLCMNLETVDYDHPEDVDPDVHPDCRIRAHHAFAAGNVVLTFFTSLVHLFRPNVPQDYLPIFCITLTVIPLIINIFILVLYKNGSWMANYSWKTLVINSTLLYSVWMIFAMSSFFPKSNLLFIGAIFLMSAMLHLRFSHFFRNPPKWYCIYTVKCCRQHIRRWYSWILIFDAFLWAGLMLFIMTSTGQSSCSEDFEKMIIRFLFIVPAVFAIKLIHSKLQKTA
uniref:Serpentine receptor class gamma n=2 Tax=Caenorhabditis tropicalis TaxID=1561998 RepID=A0A1I7TSY0_9PELO